MIKYNNSNINKWNYGSDNIVKVYRNNAVCYYKITGGGDTPTAQTPCYAVVDDISQYQDTEFEDVFNKADEKWYKLNNLNQYEEYGVYGSGRNITYYDGKLTIDGDYEYIYSGSSWENVGEVSGGTIDTVWIDPPSTNNQNASFDIGHYWGEGYKMVFNAYLSGSYGGDYGSFWRWNQHTPIEFNFYSNGFYYDFHNPTSTSAPDVATNDYSWRIMKSSSLRNYENSQIFNVILTNGTVSVKLEETGAEIVNGSTSVSTQSWYNGLYQASLGSMNNQSKCHLSHIQVYNANDELVNDIKFVKNQGVTGAQEISAYDSVLNVTYNNTNSYTPSYHIVSDSGGTTYPMYYAEMQDPPNNVSFSSMTEAEEYECPWVGMKATIDGVNYVFSGDSQSGYEWVEIISPIPSEYNELEYIEVPRVSRTTTSANLFAVPVDLQAYHKYVLDFTPVNFWDTSYYGVMLGGNDADTNFHDLGIFKLDNGWGTGKMIVSCLNYQLGRTKFNISPYIIQNTRTVISMHMNGYVANNGASISIESNGVEVFTGSSTTKANSSYNPTIGIRNVPLLDMGSSGNNTYTANLKFHNFAVMTSSDELVYNYLPVERISDGQAGLFETVNQVFYPLLGYTVTKGDPV